MNPSAFSTSNRRPRSFEAGVEIFARPRICPLRIRAKRSPIGSLIAIASRSLPAGLCDARRLTEIRKIAKRNARHLELAVEALGPARQFAAIVNPRARRIARKLGELHARGETLLGRHRHVVGLGLERRPLGGISRGHLDALLIAVDLALLRHLAPRAPRSVHERHLETGEKRSC